MITSVAGRHDSRRGRLVFGGAEDLAALTEGTVFAAVMQSGTGLILGSNSLCGLEE